MHPLHRPVSIPVAVFAVGGATMICLLSVSLRVQENMLAQLMPPLPPPQVFQLPPQPSSGTPNTSALGNGVFPTPTTDMKGQMMSAQGGITGAGAGQTPLFMPGTQPGMPPSMKTDAMKMVPKGMTTNGTKMPGVPPMPSAGTAHAKGAAMQNGQMDPGCVVSATNEFLAAVSACRAAPPIPPSSGAGTN